MTGNGNGITEGVRVELYARSSLPAVAERRRESVANRLEGMVEEGHVGTVETETYRKKVPLGEPSPERALYERFGEWASDVGVGLEPFFDTRECYSMETGDRGERLVLPALCIAIYRDDRLKTVYPHSTPQGSRTVLDCLNAIETIETDPRAFETDGVDTREEASIEAE